MTRIANLPRTQNSALKFVTNLRDQGALFVVNDSGGKDSQAMKALVRNLVSDDQILVIHADLPGADWEGTFDHVLDTSEGLEVIKVAAITKTGEAKTFESMVLGRGYWPSPKYRQCTSDLKRGPIEKAIRHAVKDRENKLIVNCVGLRAEESNARKKATILKYSKKNSKAGRVWYEWLPIHTMLVGEVFDTIKAAGQEPHWAYVAGMERLSCCFCIMAKKVDLQTAARLNPDTYARYCATEEAIGQVFVMPTTTGGKLTLPQVTEIEPDAEMLAEARTRLAGMTVNKIAA